MLVVAVLKLVQINLDHHKPIYTLNTTQLEINQTAFCGWDKDSGYSFNTLSAVFFPHCFALIIFNYHWPVVLAL